MKNKRFLISKLYTLLLMFVSLLFIGSLIGVKATTPEIDGLTHYYSFDNADNLGLDVVNSNNATIQGGSATDGYKNGAYNGGDGYIHMPNNVIDGSTNQFTFSAWIYPTSKSDYQKLMDFGKNTDVFFQIMLRPGDGDRLHIQTGLTTSGDQGHNAVHLWGGTGFNAVPLNEWSHVALTVNGTNAILYVNGQIIHNGNFNVSLEEFCAIEGAQDANYLGKSHFNDPYYGGKIDEVLIYNRAISANEVIELVNGSSDKKADISSNLTHYYSFDDSYQQGLENLGGTNNVNITTTPVEGKYDLAYNGGDGYIHMPNNVIDGSTNQFTFSAWIYPTSKADYQKLMDFGKNTDVFFQIMLRPGEGDKLHIQTGLTTSGDQGSNAVHLWGGTGFNAVPLNEWSHVALTVNGTNAILYVNGQIIHNGNFNVSLEEFCAIEGAQDANYLGKSHFNDPYYGGKIDEVLIYNRALSLDDIAELANGSLPEKVVLGHTHNLVKNDETDSTCSKAGNVAYWTCSICSNHYLDENCENQVALEDTIKPTLNHEYTVLNHDNKHHWYECKNCNIINETSKEAHIGAGETCTKPGVCEVCNVEFIGIQGHSYGEVTYVWNEDLTECTATRVCSKDATHIDEEAVKVQVTVNKPTCTETGLNIYVADFQNPDFETQMKSKETAATGHTYDKLNGDDKNHWNECVCGEIKENSSEAHTGGEPTCEEHGVCTVCSKEYIEPLGHDYTERIEDEEHFKANTKTDYVYWLDCSKCEMNAKDDPNAQDKVFTVAKPEADTTTGLTHYYSFDNSEYPGLENLEGVDNAQIIGSTTEGNYGNALAGDGYLYLPDNVIDGSTNQFTFSVWIYPTSRADYQKVMDLGKGTDVFFQIMVRPGEAGKLHIQTGLTTSGDQGSNAVHLWGGTGFNAVELNTWSHVALTVNDKTAVLYVNGKVVQSGEFKVSLSEFCAIEGAQDQNYLGKSHFNDPLFGGKLDEAIFYNRALSAYEIEALSFGYLPEKNVTSGKQESQDIDVLSNLEYFYSFEGKHAGTDYSGAKGNAIMSSDSIELKQENGVNAELGKYMVFDGKTDFIVLPQNVVPKENSEFTFATWIYFNSLGEYTRIFDFGESTKAYFDFRLRANGVLETTLTNNSTAGETRVSTSTGVVKTKEWMHVALTVSERKVNIYVNGELVGTGNFSRSLNTLYNKNLTVIKQNYIGLSRYGQDPKFNGLMDELRVYNRALNSAEIAYLAKGNKAPVEQAEINDEPFINGQSTLPQCITAVASDIRVADDSYIINSNVTVKELISKLTLIQNAKAVVVDNYDFALSDDDIVTTGCYVKVYYNNKVVERIRVYNGEFVVVTIQKDNGDPDVEEIVLKGETINLPYLVKEGYELSGYKADGNTVTDTLTVNSNITVVAQYVKREAKANVSNTSIVNETYVNIDVMNVEKYEVVPIDVEVSVVELSVFALLTEEKYSL